MFNRVSDQNIRSTRRARFARAALILLLALAAIPARPVRAGGVVGNGAPASCTEAAFDAALTGGGTVTFNCGAGPHTILITSQKSINANTTIDGGGKITLDGQNAHRLFDVGDVLTLRNIVLTRGYFNGDGGAIRNTPNGTLLLETSTIRDSTATASGGAILSYGPLTISNSLLEGNQALNGGALYPRWPGARTTIINSVLRNNHATDTTNGWGGAILAWDGAPITIEASDIYSNSAQYGGGIYNYPNSVLTLQNNTRLRDNRATVNGGGIYNLNGSTATLTDVTLSGNTAQNIGGGIYNDNSNPTMTNVIFSSNSAQSGGGMFNISSSNPTLTNVTFNTNSAQNDGGGMYNLSSSPTLTNVTFSGNTAPKSGGGAIYNLSSSPALTNVTFSGNSAQSGGGMFNISSSSPSLTNVTFSGNSAQSGGGMYNGSSSPSLTNVTFSGNSAQSGGGMYNSNSSATLTNVTFSGNSAQIGGGILYSITNTLTLANTILAGNTASTGPDCSGALISQGYNLIGNNSGCTFTPATGDQVGTSSSPLDPKLGPLQDNGGLTLTRALLPGSRALDKGSPAVPGSGGNACATTDQRGVPRPQPQGGRCDIGAYEFIDPDTTSTMTAHFDAPTGIAANAAGSLILVTDSVTHTIRKIDVLSGTGTTLAGQAGQPGSTDGDATTAKFRYPSGVALNADGRLALVADTGNNTIRKIDVLSSTVTTLVGLAGVSGSKDGISATAQFSEPVGIAMDPGGTFALVTDYGNSTIRKIAISTRLVTTLAGTAMITDPADGTGAAAHFFHPTGIALSANGAFALVADTGHNTIRKIDVTTGRVTTLALLNAAGRISVTAFGGRIQGIQGISLDPEGCTAVIADSRIHVIRSVDVLTGTISAVAGTAMISGTADGSGMNAQFNTPEGVALTNGGSTAFVADTNNSTVRRIDGIPPPKCWRGFLPIVRR